MNEKIEKMIEYKNLSSSKQADYINYVDCRNGLKKTILSILNLPKDWEIDVRIYKLFDVNYFQIEIYNEIKKFEEKEISKLNRYLGLSNPDIGYGGIVVTSLMIDYNIDEYIIKSLTEVSR